MKLYYGLTSRYDVFKASQRAVSVFGGNTDVVNMLLGTACAESHLGTHPDRHPTKLGVSLVQIDQIRFDDTIARTRVDNRNKFKANYGVSLNDLKLEDLAYNPFLAMAFARLIYILIPEKIPSDIEGQAQYWKTYWNTYADNAAGTVEKYIEDWHTHMILD